MVCRIMCSDIDCVCVQMIKEDRDTNFTVQFIIVTCVTDKMCTM